MRPLIVFVPGLLLATAAWPQPGPASGIKTVLSRQQSASATLVFDFGWAPDGEKPASTTDPKMTVLNAEATAAALSLCQANLRSELWDASYVLHVQSSGAVQRIDEWTSRYGLGVKAEARVKELLMKLRFTRSKPPRRVVWLGVTLVCESAPCRLQEN